MINLEAFNSNDSYNGGTRVVIRTDRGLELGTIVAEVPEEDHPHIAGTVMHRAAEKEISRQRHIDNDLAPEQMVKAMELVRKHKLEMRIVEVEHILGGEKIVFYFRANGRVDFRELVRDMAREFNTRIELKQIGVRDEAKLLADYDHCGREICCRSFMREIKPVTMKMAKNQKATLDPSKISGRCGRLMCCLRFEDDVYRDLKKTLPRRNSMVETPHGVGRVVDADVLGQTVTVLLENKRAETVSVDDLGENLGKAASQQQQQKPSQDRPDKDNREKSPRGHSRDDRPPGDRPRENDNKQSDDDQADKPKTKRRRGRRRSRRRPSGRRRDGSSGGDKS
ncbi:MAG: PSP1 domain-containing protein [Planctomycetota bacterium]